VVINLATYFEKKGKKMRDILISIGIIAGAALLSLVFGYFVFSFVVA
jgi:hypothetical protein